MENQDFETSVRYSMADATAAYQTIGNVCKNQTYYRIMAEPRGLDFSDYFTDLEKQANLASDASAHFYGQLAGILHGSLGTPFNMARTHVQNFDMVLADLAKIEGNPNWRFCVNQLDMAVGAFQKTIRGVERNVLQIVDSMDRAIGRGIYDIPRFPNGEEIPVYITDPSP